MYNRSHTQKGFHEMKTKHIKSSIKMLKQMVDHFGELNSRIGGEMLDMSRFSTDAIGVYLSDTDSKWERKIAPIMAVKFAKKHFGWKNAQFCFAYDGKVHHDDKLKLKVISLFCAHSFLFSFPDVHTNKWRYVAKSVILELENELKRRRSEKSK